MQDEHKLRIALGVFDELNQLKTTLGEFEAFGLDPGHTVVVANTGALDGKLEEELAPSEFRDLAVAPSLLIRGNSNGAAKIADCRAGVTRFLAAEQLLHFEGWVAGRLSKDLNDHLASGACVLVAPITDPGLEWWISNTLLKYSVSPVQLHDLANLY